MLLNVIEWTTLNLEHSASRLQYHSYSTINVLSKLPPSTPTPNITVFSPRSITESELSSSISPSYAAISRAAGQGVRLAFSRGSSHYAYHTVNSIIKSHHDYLLSNEPVMRRGSIPFHQHTRPDFAAHCLVHCLLRVGLTIKAARCLGRLLSAGIFPRVRTFNATLRLLLSDDSITRTTCEPATDHQSSPVLGVPLKQACYLVSLAQKHRIPLQGEIYVKLMQSICSKHEPAFAATIFCKVARKWFVDLQPRSCLADNGVSIRKEILSSRRRTETSMSRSGRDIHSVPKPTHSMIRPLLHYLEEQFRAPQLSETLVSQRRMKKSLEAAVRLADLIDRGIFPMTEAAQLLKVLYSVPREEESKTTRGSRADVYHRVHGILSRLVQGLPDSGRQPQATYSPRYLKHQLDLQSCNSLLYYALWHRRSPDLAARILRHMFRWRNPPLQPDTATFNIIARATTLLRLNDVAEAAVGRLDNAFQNISNTSGELTDTTKRLGTPAWIRHNRSHELTTLLPSSPNQTGDTFSQVAQIMHFLSTGQTTQLLRMAQDLFPGYDGEPGRSDTESSNVSTGTRLGPQVLCSLLAALSKSRRPALVKRLWYIATQAETTSWTFDTSSGVKSWVLPIEGYTVMMQTHFSEAQRARKGMAKLHSVDIGNCITPDHPQRWIIAFNQAQRVYSRLMQDRPRALYTSQGCSFVRRPTYLEHPGPDMRFFNSALEMFHMYEDEDLIMDADYWHARLKEATDNFSRTGVQHTPATSQLLRVLWDMADRGHSVPHRYREYLLDKPHATTVTSRPNTPVPYCFPSQTKTHWAHPYRLFVKRSRGQMKYHVLV